MQRLPVDFKIIKGLSSAKGKVGSKYGYLPRGSRRYKCESMLAAFKDLGVSKSILKLGLTARNSLCVVSMLLWGFRGVVFSTA